LIKTPIEVAAIAVKTSMGVLLFREKIFAVSERILLILKGMLNYLWKNELVYGYR